MPSAHTRAADRYCLVHMARLDLSADVLKDADAYFRQSDHWSGSTSGATKVSLVIPTIPSAQRPPMVPSAELKAWAYDNISTRHLKGRHRSFRVCESLLYPAPRGGLRAWDVLETWLRFLSVASCTLVYDEKFGFGLTTAVAIKKPSKGPGPVLVPGAWCVRCTRRYATAPLPSPPLSPRRSRRLRQC